MTDADSEEEHRIVAYRDECATHDIVGDAGGPITGAGFALTTPDGAELHLGAGRYYVAGTLLEDESEISFTEQPDRVDPPWPPAAGRRAIFLETWRRLVTALDDPSIREVALGGPTTSARERVVWQVGATGVAADWVCTDALPAIEQTTGGLAARAEPDALLSSPCLVPPQAGYTGLENRVYRVEVLTSGEAYDVAALADTAVATGFPAGEPHQVTVDALGALAVGDAGEVFSLGSGRGPCQGDVRVRHRDRRSDAHPHDRAAGVRALNERPPWCGAWTRRSSCRGTTAVWSPRSRPSTGLRSPFTTSGRTTCSGLRSANWLRSPTTASSSKGWTAVFTRSPT